jgi:hypothetical protein
MKRIIAVLGFLSLASAAAATEAFDLDAAYAEAERDFAASRAELGTGGSAPLVGLDRTADERAWEERARRDFEKEYERLGLSGSAPLVGLERYELTVRPQVAHVVLANARLSRRSR